MKKKCLLLIILISCKTIKPVIIDEAKTSTSTSYLTYWKSKGYEYGVVNYKIQKSRTGKGSWTTLPSGTFQPKHLPDSNTYIFTLPKTSLANYYRILATMLNKQTFTLDTKYLSTTAK